MYVLIVGFIMRHISLRRVKNVKIPTHRVWNPDRVVAAVPRIRLFKAHWLLYVPPRLTLKNSTFCPHSVFMCFVWISEQTAIISLYSINWLVFVTETQFVYCAVRTGSLNKAVCAFVFIWEQTATCANYSINWLVFITEMKSVYCAVRTGSLNIN